MECRREYVVRYIGTCSICLPADSVLHYELTWLSWASADACDYAPGLVASSLSCCPDWSQWLLCSRWLRALLSHCSWLRPVPLSTHPPPLTAPAVRSHLPPALPDTETPMSLDTQNISCQSDSSETCNNWYLIVKTIKFGNNFCLEKVILKGWTIQVVLFQNFIGKFKL